MILQDSNFGTELFFGSNLHLAARDRRLLVRVSALVSPELSDFAFDKLRQPMMAEPVEARTAQLRFRVNTALLLNSHFLSPHFTSLLTP